MLKRIGVILLIVVILTAMLVFTWLNPGVLQIDLAFGAVQSSIPLAFATVFALGWLFGLLCMSMIAMRLVKQRRQLRKALRNTEAEVSRLRNRPLSDAD